MAHLGNTIVNGALRVLGGENVDTINGVTVGTSPKFTDTTYSGSTTVTLSGTTFSLTKANVTTALGYTPPTSDTNTTYTLATGDNNGQIKVTPSSGSAYNVSVKGLGNAAYATIATGVMEVGKETSRSTSSVGTWTAMCRSDQTGSPTLPVASKWYNVINLNNWTNSSTNWISQLAICTQDNPKSGIWWRTNDTGGTDISSSTWHRCIDDTIMSTHGGFFAVGGGNDVSGDGTLYYSRVDVASADQTVGIQVSPYSGMFYGWQATRSTGVNNYGVYWYSCNGSTATTKDCNAIADNGVFYYNANGPSHGFQSTDGALYAQFHSTPWGAEIAQDYRDGDLCVRGKNNGTWTAWRPIPAGLTYSDGEINTGHSRNCNDWSNSSGIFYFLSGGPDALSGFKAPDSSGTAFCHHYASNSWANMWAQDFYNDGAMYVRSNAGSTWGAWQRLIDSSQIGTARIDRTDNGVSYLQIKLNYGNDCLNQGMFTFKVSLYDSYVMRVYQISGYCYGGNHWYAPRAVKLAQAGTYSDVTHNYTNDTIYFRYDSNHNLYVYIRQEAYAGALISDVCNGYNHITNLNKIFSLSYVSSYDSTTAQGNVDLVGTGSYDLQDYSAFVGKSRTPTTAGTITLHTYGKIKQLTIWGTTWAATSGAAQLVLSITMTSNLCPTTNVEIMGHDDNGAAVFGYITNTGGVFIANRNAVPVYITATYI